MNLRELEIYHRDALEGALQDFFLEKARLHGVHYHVPSNDRYAWLQAVHRIIRQHCGEWYDDLMVYNEVLGSECACHTFLPHSGKVVLDDNFARTKAAEILMLTDRIHTCCSGVKSLAAECQAQGEAAVESSSRKLIAWIMQCTECGDGWGTLLTMAIQAFWQVQGVPETDASDQILKQLWFNSYHTPTDTEFQSAAETLAWFTLENRFRAQYGEGRD